MDDVIVFLIGAAMVNAMLALFGHPATATFRTELFLAGTMLVIALVLASLELTLPFG